MRLFDQFFHARLDDRCVPGVELLHFRGIEVHADDGVSFRGQACGGDRSDIAQPENADSLVHDGGTNSATEPGNDRLDVTLASLVARTETGQRQPVRSEFGLYSRGETGCKDLHRAWFVLIKPWARAVVGSRK